MLEVLLKSKNLKLIKKSLFIFLLILVCSLEDTITMCEEFEKQVLEDSDEKIKNEISYKTIFICLGIALLIGLVVYSSYSGGDLGGDSTIITPNELFENSKSANWVDLQKGDIRYIQLSNDNPNIIHWTDMSKTEFLKTIPNDVEIGFLGYTPAFDVDPDTVTYKLVTMKEIRALNLDLSSHVR